MIEKGTYLFKEEFWRINNISKGQWERRRDELLLWLENFYEYKLLEGKPLRIEIKEVYGEYQPLPRKIPQQDLLTEQKLKDYENYTIAALGTEFKPNSKAKIARDAIDDFGLEKYCHTNAEAVARRYVTPAFDEHAETNDKMVWVDYANYLPLDEEVLIRWKQILSEEQMDEEHRANAFDRMMQGEDISQEKGYYKKALKRFKEETGIVPVHVREWRNQK